MRDEQLYLLDTNVLSNLEKARPHPRLLDWIGRVEADRLAIPLSAVFEIQFGIELARRCHPERAHEKEDWLSRVLAREDMRIVVPGVDAIRMRARMYAEPSLRNFFVTHPGSNKPKTGEDLLIAASAIAEDAIVVTFNVEDFMAIDRFFELPGLYDPGADRWPIAPRPKRMIKRYRTRDIGRRREPHLWPAPTEQPAGLV